jgi:hypothetical protein
VQQESAGTAIEASPHINSLSGLAVTRRAAKAVPLLNARQSVIA